MKKHLIHTIISAMVIWSVYGPASALSAEDTADNQVFLGMINKIREAPYKYAKDLGYDPGSITSDTNFNPYTLDPDDLTDRAEAESKAMAAGEDAPEPTNPPVYRLTASTGGVVSFFNFMSREKAFEIVINYLFKKELATNEFLYILSKEYSHAGIAISAGKVGSGNAWFVAISLGSPERVSEIQMLNLINQLRANPKENIWKYTQLNEEEAVKLNRNIQYLVASDNAYKPLFFDVSLSASAQARSSYELNGTYPLALSEAQTDLDRAADYDYEGECAQEYALRWKKVRSSTEENGPSVDESFVDESFRFLIQKELEDWPQSHVAFLNDFQDIGSNIDSQSGEQSGEIFDVYVASFVVGKNAQNTSSDDSSSMNNEQTAKIYGVLFSDIDGNKLYSPGEELSQKEVTVSVYSDDVGDMQEVKKVVTDNAGHFSMELPANRQYSFTATIDGVSVTWNNDNIPITSDQFVPLPLPYTPPAP